MARITYINERYVPHHKAMVHVDDRGYLFSDGVYEVMVFYNHAPLDEALHLKRLQYSLRELKIAEPMSMKALLQVIRTLIARNKQAEGIVYLQVTRGEAMRNHLFPEDTKPGVMITILPPKFPRAQEVVQGVGVITMKDMRWGRRDIKSISLLPNVLARQHAHEAGAREAWLLNEKGTITEGSLSNSFLVMADNTIITHPADENILGGITRDVVLKLARKAGFKVQERAFTMGDIKKAKEAFLTSTTSNVLPVVKVDGKKIGTGKPGKVTKQLLALYLAHIKKQTGFSYEEAA